MNNDFLSKYEQEVEDRILKTVAKNLKDILPDEEIAKRTGLTLKEVQNL